MKIHEFIDSLTFIIVHGAEQIVKSSAIKNLSSFDLLELLVKFEGWQSENNLSNLINAKLNSIVPALKSELSSRTMPGIN